MNDHHLHMLRMIDQITNNNNDAAVTTASMTVSMDRDHELTFLLAPETEIGRGSNSNHLPLPRGRANRTLGSTSFPPDSAMSGEQFDRRRARYPTSEFEKWKPSFLHQHYSFEELRLLQLEGKLHHLLAEASSLSSSSVNSELPSWLQNSEPVLQEDLGTRFSCCFFLLGF
jgi:hypothetical protein